MLELSCGVCPYKSALVEHEFRGFNDTCLLMIRRTYVEVGRAKCLVFQGLTGGFNGFHHDGEERAVITGGSS